MSGRVSARSANAAVGRRPIRSSPCAPDSTATRPSPPCPTAASRPPCRRAGGSSGGPNGGYVAAVVLRALSTRRRGRQPHPRSFTVHYLAPPAEGPVQIEVQTERTGRMLTFVSGRVSQDGRLIATAQAAFAPPLPGVEFCDLQPPDVVPPDAIEPMVMPPGAPVIPLRERYEQRWAVGSPPFSGAPQAVAGGWIRLRPDEGTRARRPPPRRRLDRRVDAAGVLARRHPDGGAHHRSHHPLPLAHPARRRRVVPRRVPVADGHRRVRGGRRRGVERGGPAAGPLPPARRAAAPAR